MHAPRNLSKDFLLMVVLVYHTYGLYNLEEENLEKKTGIPIPTQFTIMPPAGVPVARILRRHCKLHSLNAKGWILGGKIRYHVLRS